MFGLFEIRLLKLYVGQCLLRYLNFVTNCKCNLEFATLVPTYNWLTLHLRVVLINFPVANQQSNHLSQCRLDDEKYFQASY